MSRLSSHVLDISEKSQYTFFKIQDLSAIQNHQVIHRLLNFVGHWHPCPGPTSSYKVKIFETGAQMSVSSQTR